MRLQGMDLNRFFLDAIHLEAIKAAPTPTIKTAFIAMALSQKLPRPSYKSNVNNISHQACFLKLKFPWQKIFEVFVHSIINTVVPTPLFNYRTTCGALIRKTLRVCSNSLSTVKYQLLQFSNAGLALYSQYKVVFSWSCYATTCQSGCYYMPKWLVRKLVWLRDINVKIGYNL